MYARRGGREYFKSEAKIQWYMLKNRIVNLPRFLYNVVGRFVIEIMMPNSIRAVVFQKLLRK